MTEVVLAGEYSSKIQTEILKKEKSGADSGADRGECGFFFFTWQKQTPMPIPWIPTDAGTGCTHR
ncbi:MAG: hypothetical protein ABW168_10485 [Sedimenticola sp.]